MELLIVGTICAVLGGCVGFLIGAIRGWKQTDDLYSRLAEETLLKIARNSK